MKIFAKLLAALSVVAFALPVAAQQRSVMENTRTSGDPVYVSTTPTPRLLVGTSYYPYAPDSAVKEYVKGKLVAEEITVLGVFNSTATDARFATVGASTKALNVNVSTETAARIAADNVLSASTQALNAAKVNRAGDAMTGQLRLTDSASAAPPGYDEANPAPSGNFIANSTGVVVRMNGVDGFNHLTSGGYYGFGYNGGGGAFTGICHGGTEASPTFCPSDSLISFFGSKGYDGTNPWTTVPSMASLEFYSAEDVTPSARGSYIYIGTAKIGTIQRRKRMAILDTGNTIIAPRANFVTPSGARLEVTGVDAGIGEAGNGVSIKAHETIEASTFNAVGSAYQMNGVTVIDKNRIHYGSGAGLYDVATATGLAAEISSRTNADNAIAVSTTAEAAIRLAADAAIGVATNTLRTDLTAEAATRLAADTAIGVSTRAITDSKGQANGIASLDGGAKIPVAQLPNSVMEYQGTWTPGTNTPTLADGVGNPGDVYRASADGSANTGHGVIAFFTGDFIIYSGTIWERSPMADGVQMVNGLTGAVVLTTTEIPEGTRLYYTDVRAQAANAASFTAVGVATNTLRTDLNTEAATRLAADTAIGVATNTLRTDLTTEAATRLTADTAIGVATNTLRTDLSAETASRVAADTAIGVATNTIRNDFTAADTAIGVATNTLRTDLTTEAATRLAADVAIGVATNTIRNDFTTADTAIGASTQSLRTDKVETASNVGSGSGVFKQKVTTDLQFKSLVAGTNITLTPGTNDITIAASGSGGHGISTGSLTVGATIYPQRTNLVFDSAFFKATDLASLNETFIGISTSASITVSSQTSNGWPAATGSNSTFGSCLSGSTLTITTNGGDVDYQFTGSCRLDGTSNRMGLVVYQDGNVTLPAKLSASGLDGTNTIADLGMGSPSVATVEGNCSFTKTFKNVSAGLHSYCLAAAINTGNWSICGTYGACSGMVREVGGISAGSGGHTIASGTVSGSAMPTSTSATQRTRLGFDSAAFDILDDSTNNTTIVKAKGYQYLASTVTYIAQGLSSQNTNLNPSVCLATATITTGNNPVLIVNHGGHEAGSSYMLMNFLIDGQSLPGWPAGGTKFTCGTWDNGSNEANMACSVMSPVLSAGVHNICIAMGSSGGGPVRQQETAVIELGTGGNGVSAAASTATLITTGQNVVGTNWLTLPGSTVTLTMAGGKLLVGFTCNVSHSVGGDSGDVGLLINGNYVPGENATTGLITMTAASANNPTPASLTWMSTTSYTGTTTASVIFRSQQAAVSFYLNQNNNQACHLFANEVRNAAGTGDVSSNGNNTMSGANAITGSLSVGSQVYSSTVNPVGLIKGGWTTVAVSSFPDGTSEAWIYNFVSSVTYRVHYALSPSANGAQLQMSVAGLPIANAVSYNNRCYNSNGSDYSTTGNVPAAGFVILTGSDGMYGSGSTGDDAGVVGQFEMAFNHKARVLYGFGQSSYYNFAVTDLTGCSNFWSKSRGLPTPSPYPLKFYMSSGTMSGRIWVEQMTLVQPY